MADSSSPAVTETIDQFDAEGRITRRSHLQSGALQGDLSVFGPDGTTQVKAPYVDGLLDGILVTRDDDGRLLQEACYSAGVQHGATRVYAAGRLLMEQVYLQGKLHGLSVMYSEAGQVSAKQMYVQGLLEGEAVYLSEGRIVRKVTYRAGVQNGETVDFSRDEKPVQKSFYKDNLLEGTVTRFWPDGKILETQDYKAGKPISVLRCFDQNGDELQGSSPKPGIMQRLEQLVKG